MKKFYFLFILFSLLLPAQAQQVYTVDNTPKVHLLDKTRYACDPEGILAPAARDSIDRMLYRLEQQTGIETVVAVLPSIGNEECFDFTHRLFNTWGVGKKGKDNGLVILLVIDQRCIQFVTGLGLEGDLPDAICKRIQTRDMIPYLKNQRWSEGMVAGVRAVCARLDGTMVNDSEHEEDREIMIAFLAFGGFILIGILIVWFALRAANKCPHCGKHELQRSNSQVVSRKNGVKTENVTYICRHCGHVLTRRQQSYDENYHGGRGGGPVIFGSGGGFGGGGGFSGGSFGGGFSGGGGAGSRF